MGVHTVVGEDHPDSGSVPEGLGDAVLDALFSQSPVGLHVYDQELRLMRVNTAARLIRKFPIDRLLGRTLPELLRAFDITDAAAVERAAHRVLETGVPELDLTVRFRDRRVPPVETVSSVSVFRLQRADGTVLGLAAALTDITARVRAEAEVRLQNEAAARIGTTLDIFRTAAEFCEVVSPALADTVTVDVYDVVLGGRAPAADSLDRDQTVRRVGYRSVAGPDDQGVPAVGEVDVYPPGTPYRTVLDTLAPKLIRRLRPDGDRWLDPRRRRDARILSSQAHSMLLVPIRARGVVLGLACFYRWRDPAPFDRRHLRLAQQLTTHAGQCLDNARLYGRERSAARILSGGFAHAQASVVTAVELARTHLPAGTGGGWSDAVALSGSRVALVAGDTTTGTSRPAAMSELRAAIEALADLDLAPDEILQRLHDLASRPSTPWDTAEPDAGDQSPATCLCLVYDPVSRLCTAASAGHPSPVLVHPGGAVELLDVAAGPPLGQGLAEYALTERVLPEGSTLLICNTALLTAAGGRESMLSRLTDLFAEPQPSLQAACDSCADALAPEQPSRDAYLLLARTRTLDASRTKAWTFPNSPESAGQARRKAVNQLAEWGLAQDVIDDTALVVSELVTNSVRYAKGPIQLRLIHDGTLVCEVTDDSSASPHLRRALDTDENGRGLFITAHLTQRWGVRPSGRGKTLWAARTLPTPPAPGHDPAADE
ncbi:SpoIIE family protein phosphatase [Streptomyces gardneri]|uniref:SpoIIE family protein phosphatase n=1 Tax=Streptomyces gardneri TaxID=66892 RepID=UPI000A8FF97D|nr:SpoIIE family protein phosphatase [Streptomyces gardneri]QPK50084.1 SpoIIE family protein phosphatase [Streptomyces gardneri]WRK41667.1 SpoIIE family protein phosphatase [Streptomyces venezuelae]